MNQKYQTLQTIAIGLLGLSLVVVVHELGHFFACKVFGVYTPTFSIGFDPQLWSIMIGSTEFQLGALPLGGYVSIDPDALAAVAYWKKMVIILAGIFSNIIFALGIFFFMIFHTTQKAIPVIESVLPHSPAHKAGLLANDQIIAIDEEPLNADGDLFIQKIGINPGKTMLLTIERNSLPITIAVTLDAQHPLYGQGIGFLGAPLKMIAIPRPPLKSVAQNTKLHLFKLFKHMSSVMSTVFNKEQRQNIVGPLGIITGIGKSAQVGLEPFFFFIAIISLNIAFFNLIPIPFLDGGKAVQFTIEALLGRSLSPAFISTISILFFILFLLFIMFVSIADIRGLRKK